MTNSAIVALPGVLRLPVAGTWAEFVPFLGFDAEIYTTDAIESVNARIRKAVKARGHFPTEAAALKCVEDPEAGEVLDLDLDPVTVTLVRHVLDVDQRPPRW